MSVVELGHDLLRKIIGVSRRNSNELITFFFFFLVVNEKKRKEKENKTEEREVGWRRGTNADVRDGS